MIIYTVKSGDNVYRIARRFGTTSQRIIADNDLQNPSELAVGQKIVILQPRTVYTVKEGDTLYSVAQMFSVPVNQLLRNNPSLEGSETLRTGQELIISLPEPTYGNIDVNAYAYTGIDPTTLQRTLPYLTYLTIFSYGINENGELIDIDDEEIIETARRSGVAPIMLLSTLTEDGTFSSERATMVLSSEDIQNNLIAEILQTVEEKRYEGVDVDFEYVEGEYAQAYADFLERLRQALSEQGRKLFVALAPKTSADMPGLLYEGHDYAALGDAADKALLMTYEWGYTYGEPQAVSPINKVREVVEYGVSEIPREKILLGVPNYGYDWPLPYVQGETKAQSLSNNEAVERAKENNAEIQYDQTAQAPFYTYYVRENGTPIQHIVWFEDASSVDAMLKLINEYGLSGMSVWNIMRYFPSLWTVLNSLYRINKVLN